MFESFYTTQMSAKGKTLQTRFMKMRSKNGRFSRIAGLIMSAAVVFGLACVLIACAAADGRKNNDETLTNLDFSVQQLKELGKRNIGAIMADIAYAEGDKAVFYYADGVFVYDFAACAIVRSFDLNKLSCAHFQQGDYTLHITVGSDGKTALLVNDGVKDDIKDFKNYRLDLENGTAYETEETKLPDPAGGFAESSEAVNDKGWLSTRCIRNNGKLYYLTMKEGGKWGNIRLVRLDEETGEKNQWYVFEEDNTEMFSLYETVSSYLESEFRRVYSPHYEILDSSISNWQENGNEATFFYTMTEKNYDRDPDTVGYIIKARESGDKNYETYKKEYLMPRETNYEFKAVYENGKIKLFFNTAPKGEEWTPVKIDNFIAQ